MSLQPLGMWPGGRAEGPTETKREPWAQALSGKKSLQPLSMWPGGRAKGPTDTKREPWAAALSGKKEFRYKGGWCPGGDNMEFRFKAEQKET